MSNIIQFLPQSPPAKWHFTLGPKTGSDILFNTGKAPNRFQRYMQKICLGIYWDKNYE